MKGAALREMSNVLVRQDALIRRHDRNTEHACRGHDHLIRRVAMKQAGELGRLDHDAWRQRHEPHARVGERLLKPLADRARQDEPTDLNELGNLPAGDDADAEAEALVPLDDLAHGLGEARISMHPPHPHVGVEEDHDCASQSSGLSGSVGATYVTGVPRSEYG